MSAEEKCRCSIAPLPEAGAPFTSRLQRGHRVRCPAAGGGVPRATLPLAQKRPALPGTGPGSELPGVACPLSLCWVPRRASCPGPSCCVGRARTHAPGSCRMPAMAMRGGGSRGGSGQQSRARLTVDGTLIALPSAAPAYRAGWFESRRGHPRDAGVAWPQQSESLPLQITCPQGRESDSGLCICDSAVTESVGYTVQSAGGPHGGRWP